MDVRLFALVAVCQTEISAVVVGASKLRKKFEIVKEVEKRFGV